MLVLGISCYYHDSAVALIDDHQIRFAIHEERLSRRKHDPRFPVLAIANALAVNGLRVNDVDRIVFYENPVTKANRLWDQVIDYWPRSRGLFDHDLPVFLHHKFPIEHELRDQLGFFREVAFSEHHRSHAASAFFTSPFERALVVTLDGVGEYETASVHLGEGNRLTKVRSIRFPDSLGLFYSVFTQYLGFEVNEGEYKVMGLAPYGRPKYLDKLIGPVLSLGEGGAFALNRRFFDFCSRERHYDPRLIEHLGVPPRSADQPVREEHYDLAASVQQALEIAMSGIVGSLIREFGTRDFCFAGGIALNCTANARLIREHGIRSHIHPAAGDAGAALGAALQSVMQSRHDGPVWRYSFSPYLGIAYPKSLIKATLALNEVPYRESADVADTIAAELAAGNVVAVLHGRDEWGPRALGGRSILADPRRAEMKDHLNAKIKFREEFRPFAPVVKQEAYGDWFETLGMADSPYMLYTHQALRPERTAAVTHVDGTSRVQTVSREQNRYLYDILDAFERRTGVPVLINTSFNLRGEPIVSSPADALKTFLASGIDCLALENLIVDKRMPEVTCRGGDVAGLRSIHMIIAQDAGCKTRYYDRERMALRPNQVFLKPSGDIAFATNALALKGAPRDPSRKLAVIWGDSVVFGEDWGWPHMLDQFAPGYQFLNGGLEGDSYTNVLRRAEEFNREHRVALNLLMLGWHPFVMLPSGGKPRPRPWYRPNFARNENREKRARWPGNRRLRSDLAAFLTKVPNTVVLTMPTALNHEIYQRDLSAHIDSDGDAASRFIFLGNLPYHLECQKQIFEHIGERNEIAREVCNQFGIRVIDLFEEFDSRRAGDFREHFADIIHVRPLSYPQLARAVFEGVKDLLVEPETAPVGATRASAELSLMSARDGSSVA